MLCYCSLDMKLTWICLALLLSAAREAVNLNSAKVIQPFLDDDPSPIADVFTYVPDQYDCPLLCYTDYTNVHRWTPYYSVERLQRCELSMLLHFSALRPLDDPETDILIRACTLGTPAGDATIPIENPKHGAELFQASLNTAPACAIDGLATDHGLAFTIGGGEGLVSGKDLMPLLKGMKTFFDATDNCDETFLFAYHIVTVVSLHIGAGLGKPTVSSAIRALEGRLLPALTPTPDLYLHLLPAILFPCASSQLNGDAEHSFNQYVIKTPTTPRSDATRAFNGLFPC